MIKAFCIVYIVIYNDVYIGGFKMIYNQKFVFKLSDYHRKRRKKRFDKKGVVVRWIFLHNVFHKLLLPVIKALRKIRKQKLVIVSDNRGVINDGTIFAVTHIGGNDVEITFETLELPAYLFLGDPRELYCNIDGFMLFLNGAICVETDDKNDRYIAKKSAIELLKKGGNLIIYPEGTWNISENLLILPLYAGCLEMAKESRANIVPVALEKYNNTYYVNVGEQIHYEEIELSDKAEMARVLRDNLATLKWEILEQFGVHKREDIPDNYVLEFINEIMNGKETSFTVEDAYKSIYRPKGVVLSEEVFAPIRKLRNEK